MSIRIIGIDHSLAGLDVRAKFSFTKKSAAEAMEQFKELEGVKGCVLLSTCNRMELWASTTKECEQDLLVWLCHYKGLAPFEYDRYFVKREGKEAVEHLFSLACGLKSMILAEDQILDAGAGGAFSFQRKLLRGQCAGGVVPKRSDGGEAGEDRGGFYPRKQYRHGPGHCHACGYRIQPERENLYGDWKRRDGTAGGADAETCRSRCDGYGAPVQKRCRQHSGRVQKDQLRGSDGIVSVRDLVVSATSSPNYTIRRELLDGIVLEHPMILIDLAVPRDIEPSLSEMEQISLYDIDAFRLRGDQGQ